MKCDKKAMLLYAVTDRAWVGRQSLYEQVEAALKGGATCVQLREKELDDETILKAAYLFWFADEDRGEEGKIWRYFCK